MKKTKNSSPWFIGGNLLGFGLMAFLLVLLVQRTTTNTNVADVRARANQAKGIAIIAKVVTINTATRTLIINTLKMANTNTQIPGTWSAKADATADLSSIRTAKNVLFDVNPVTFSVDNRTFTFYSAQNL